MKLIRLLFGMIERLFLWLIALVLVAASVAFAQTTIPQVGNVVVTDYIWTIASLAIGWLVKEVSSPLTALLKQRFGFQGSATQYVYVLLSAVFVVAFGLVSGAFGGGAAGWWAAAGALITAILKGFGDYAKLQQAAASAVPVSKPLPALALLDDHVVFPSGTPGTEPLIHKGRVIGAVMPLNGGLA